MLLNELAIRSKVSKSYLSYIEWGIQNNPSIDLLKKVANELHVKLSDLLEEQVMKDYDEMQVKEK